MELLTPEKYNEYETFVQTHPAGSFMQSVHWGQVKAGWKQETLLHRNADSVIDGSISILIRKLGIASMMYAPRGPVCDFTDKAVLSSLLEDAKALAKQYNAYVLKMDPFMMVDEPNTAESIALFRSLGCEIDENPSFHATTQPRYNYMLTYIKDMQEDDLLMAFNSNTRYYIRFAIKHGVVCENKGLDGLDEFYDIYSSTGDRQGFNIRSKEYLKTLLTAFGDNARLYMCYYENEPLCGGICIQYAGRTSHVYGCTKYNKEMRKLHPTYLLQWEMMKWALEGNCSIYDMQGIAIREEDDASLYNVYGFKKNFKGSVVTTVGEFDLVFRPIYNKLINFALKVRSALKKH